MANTTIFAFESLDSAIPTETDSSVLSFTKDGLNWYQNIILDWKKPSPSGDYRYTLSRWFDSGTWKFSLPYDNFTIETYSDVGLIPTVFVCSRFEESLCFTVSVMAQDGRWVTQPSIFKVSLTIEGKWIIQQSESCQVDQKTVKEFVWMLMDRIHYFNSCPSDPLLKVSVPTDKSISVNNKRVRLGKVPVYEFKILCVDNEPMVPRRPYQGGSHASPTMHLRRGHFRRYKGTKVWVDSCVVGLAENGITLKGYHVS